MNGKNFQFTIDYKLFKSARVLNEGDDLSLKESSKDKALFIISKVLWLLFILLIFINSGYAIIKFFFFYDGVQKPPIIHFLFLIFAVVVGGYKFLGKEFFTKKSIEKNIDKMNVTADFTDDIIHYNRYEENCEVTIDEITNVKSNDDVALIYYKKGNYNEQFLIFPNCNLAQEIINKYNEIN